MGQSIGRPFRLKSIYSVADTLVSIHYLLVAQWSQYNFAVVAAWKCTALPRPFRPRPDLSASWELRSAGNRLLVPLVKLSSLAAEPSLYGRCLPHKSETHFLMTSRLLPTFQKQLKRYLFWLSFAALAIDVLQTHSAWTWQWQCHKATLKPLIF